MIKAIIFDFFGVLAGRDSLSFRQTFYPDDDKKIESTKKLLNYLGLGLIGYQDYIDGLVKLGGVDRETVLKYTEDYQPNTQLLDYIRDHLKPKYKIGIVSNAGEDWVIKIIGDKNSKIFDDIILSYKTGYIKPQPQIYEMSLKNLGVKSHESVFIDDILTFCQGAESIGMNSIWYKDFDQMKTELEKILSTVTNN